MQLVRLSLFLFLIHIWVSVGDQSPSFTTMYDHPEIENVKMSYSYMPSPATSPSETLTVLPTRSSESPYPTFPVATPSKTSKTLMPTSSPFPSFSVSPSPSTRTPQMPTSSPTNSPTDLVLSIELSPSQSPTTCVPPDVTSSPFTDNSFTFEMETVTVVGSEFFDGMRNALINAVVQEYPFLCINLDPRRRRRVQEKAHDGIVGVTVRSIVIAKTCVSQVVGATCHVVTVTLRVYGVTQDDSREGSVALIDLLLSRIKNDELFLHFDGEVIDYREFDNHEMSYSYHKPSPVPVSVPSQTLTLVPTRLSSSPFAVFPSATPSKTSRTLLPSTSSPLPPLTKSPVPGTHTPQMHVPTTMTTTPTSSPITFPSPFLAPTQSPTRCVPPDVTTSPFTDKSFSFEVETITLSGGFFEGIRNALLTAVVDEYPFLCSPLGSQRRRVEALPLGGLVGVAVIFIVAAETCVSQVDGGTCHNVTVTLRVYGKTLANSRTWSVAIAELLQSRIEKDELFLYFNGDIIAVRKNQVDEAILTPEPIGASKSGMSKGARAITFSVLSGVVASIALLAFHFRLSKRRGITRANRAFYSPASCDDSIITGLYTSDPTI